MVHHAYASLLEEFEMGCLASKKWNGRVGANNDEIVGRSSNIWWLVVNKGEYSL